jgi:glutamate-1-semialdehyde 2,1-aminomutase
MILAIVQARMGSTRFPGKVMEPVCGKPLIEILFHRLSLSKKIDKIILATSIKKENDTLSEFIEKLGFEVFRGSENDVLDRYYQTSKLHSPKTVLRITGDCPLIDPKIVDKSINQFEQEQVDYLNNTTPPTYPDGMDVEIFNFETLREAWKKAGLSHDREHVSPYIRNNDKFSKSYLINDNNYGHVRLTVDEPEDLKVIVGILDYFIPKLNFDLDDIMNLKKEHPNLFNHNKIFGRDEGSKIGSGQKLWARAKHLIPGGNMLLSKRAEMFLPDKWPAYFSKSKGCKVWDLDGNEFIDMSIMGIGTNILGYGHPEVDEAVQKVVEQGNMSTFNCPEEVYLAERLIELHPWADMVRLARSGGEANAIAIRIARAATGKDNVAICGYHGWHDWYLSANLGDDKNLAGHLLPGLEPNGVPNALRGTVFPFNYNNYAELEALVNAQDIGVIKMEVVRNMGPESNFLQKVRKLTTDRGIVLIFDECTSGFRETFGGLHKKYGVEPDMALFGKALGNGYGITATIGKREIMEAAQTTFISSTFWTERIGPTAALATLKVMEQIKSWDTISQTGLNIRQGWQKLADKHGLKVNHWGLPAMTGFTFQSENAQAYKTLITQEMLAKGYLAGNSVYVCIDHTPEVVAGFLHTLDPIFALIKECEDGRDVMSLLKGPVCHNGFKRLN